MKFNRIISLMLAIMMTITVAAFCVNAEETPAVSEEGVLVIPYTKIQKGNVDKKIKAEVTTVEDPEKGEVVKISPLPDSTESGAVVVDGYGFENHKVDFRKYRYLTIEYKFSSDYDQDVMPQINFLPGTAKVLKSTVTAVSPETLKKGEWSTIVLPVSKVGEYMNEDKEFLTQLHFYPFGTKLVPSTFKAEDYILIGNWTFTYKNPNGDVEYNVTFKSGTDKAEGTAPAPIKAKFEDKVILPEIPFTSKGRIAAGWLPSTGSTILAPGSEYVMGESDVEFSVYWKDEFVAEDIIVLDFPTYFAEICEKRDTAFTSKVEIDGVPAIEVIPNPSSEKGGAINLDGWSYGGAKINVDAYATAIIVYKYISDNPVSGKMNFNVMQQNTFSGATSLKTMDEIVEGRWATATIDLTPVRAKALGTVDPIIKQIHIHPFGSNNCQNMSTNDRMYVAKIIVIPEESTGSAYHESYITGYSDGTFRVDGEMTRAEACTIVARLVAGGDANVPADKTSTFSDVTSDKWYHKYVSYVESLGYLKSYSGTFLPDQKITRAEFVELVYNMGLLKDAGKNGTFSDVPADHPRAQVIAAAGKAGLVNGYDNFNGTFSFRPDATIKRAEVVKVINNAYGKKVNADGMFGSVKGFFKDVAPTHWAYADILDAAIGHIAAVNKEGKEVWLYALDGAVVSEDFTPDYEAGEEFADQALAKMKERIIEIRNTPSTLKVSGKTYYVSTFGADTNDGLSADKPLKTVAKANALAKSGDMVVFKRGNEWRERWTAKAGVTYSAYGAGEKPVFNGNVNGDAADASLWTLVEGTTNIWKYAISTHDVGNIVVNGGYEMGGKTIEKIVPLAKNGGLYIKGVAFDPKTSFEKNDHFISVYNTINGQDVAQNENSTLYVRCDEGNPGEVYNSIEIVYRGNLIGGNSNVVFDNLCLKYSGSHGIGMGTVRNVTVQNCEIGYIGGSMQNYKNGNMTRFGNGVEVYGGCDGFTIDNCYVYQCYDAGITHQLSTGGTSDSIEQNVYFKNNVIDKCIYNIEYFMGRGDVESVVRLLKNINYTDNILARSGMGWGMSPSRSASIKGWDHNNRMEDGFKITGNLFLLDAYNACHLGASLSMWLPTFANNTYVQRYGNSFTKVGANGATQYTFNGKAAENLENKIGETGFKLYYVNPDYNANK